jgi:RNA polymerase sigma-70 factor (ECF subfamily)
MLFKGRRQAGFETLVRAHSGDLYRFAYWLCRDRFAAEDLVQEAYARAWDAWEELREPQAAKSWLFSILRNEFLRQFERKRPPIAEGVEPEDLELPFDPDIPGGLALRQALERLPETYREPLLCQVLGGFSCQEIGHMLGINEAAVMTRLTRARKALRRLVEGNPGLAREEAP